MSKLKKKQRKEKNNLIKIIILSIIILLSYLLIESSTWAVNYFGNINFSEIFYHLLVPLEGTSNDVIINYLKDCIPTTIILTVFTVFILFKFITTEVFINLKIGKLKIKINSTCNKIRIIFTILLFCFGTIYALDTIDIKDFIETQTTTSDFIETNYVDPRDVKLTFPGKKRNLIYIFLESVETTYEDMDLMPELSTLKNNNVNFNSKQGAYVLGNTSWTVAAMVGQTSGVPLNVSIDGNSMGIYDNFLPGLYNIGNVLEDNDYNNYLSIGSDKSFAARDKYFNQHGNYQIWDLYSAIDAGYMTMNDFVWWGYDDSDLFKYAKNQLTNLDKSKPFNYTMLTVNTHFQDGYLEEWCETPYDSNYANVIACASKQISSFIEWVQKQSWYENTTIILSGDHNSMNNTFFEDLDSDYIRTTYTTIINPAIEFEGEDREYCTLDMFPTTLASLGVKIEGDRLGLGTNLFSSKYTLTELYGREYVDKEIRKNSTFYTNTFFNQ